MNVAKLHRHRLLEVVRAVVPWYPSGFVALFGVVSIIMMSTCAVLVRAQSAGHGAAEDTGGDQSVQMVIAGQALIKIDPRTIWPHPFESIRPVIESADIGFTNFEMAVNPPGNGCGVPKDYVTITGEPAIGHDRRPGNTGGPHAVSADVMEFLAGMNFKLMSLANNHAWDLGGCGVRATIDAAEKCGVVHAGTGRTVEESIAPAYLTVKGTRIALIAATTSRDERDLLLGNVNGVWFGHQEDWDRNIAAVKAAAANADFVIYYQHFQITDSDFEGIRQGQQTDDGHFHVDSVHAWQESFAKAVIDAGASIYIGHGHRGFDGVEIYKGRPIFRQFGGFAYHAMRDIGGYPGEYAFWGLLGRLTIEDGSILRIEFTPLALNEGHDLIDQYERTEFLRRRGMAEIATGDLAIQILRRLQRLSADYGTDISVDGERALLIINRSGN